MHRILDRYHATSFRGRLLLLLVAVSFVQASVAAVTFFDLQSTPAEQRIRAQLDAALRGVAPTIDHEIDRSRGELIRLRSDSALQQAMAAEDWTTADQILAQLTDGEDASANPNASSSDGLEPVTSDDTVPVHAFITDAEGQVVAGTKPEGTLITKGGLTSSRMVRDTKLVATLHVPVAVDSDFIDSNLRQYLPKGTDVFVADEGSFTTSRSGVGTIDRPSGLNEGVREITVDGARQLALIQPLLDGSYVVGAMLPSSRAQQIREEGRTRLWGFIALLGLLMLLVSWTITKAVGDTLRRYADITRELADGQLGRRIPVTGTDEIADLSTSFNDMAESLQDRIGRLMAARASMRRQVDLFGEALANATDSSEMLQAVCSLALEATEASHSRFWMIDDDGRYQHAACIGLRPADTEPSSLEKAVPVRNAPVLSDGVPAWLVVPARRRDGQIVGLLTLVSTAGSMGEDDVRVAERIAVQAAVAIDNARMHEQLKLQATRDGLTGLPNHRSLQDELTLRIDEAYSTGAPLGVCMLDIDNFKRVNDTYGHPVGDEAIKAIAGKLAAGIGDVGMVGRYGGEEFVVIMPGCDADTACRIADRLREDIMTIRIPLENGGVLAVTSSFGVANVDQQHAGVRVDNAELLHQADVGLYNAKRSGKNKVTLAGPTSTVIEMSAAEQAKLQARERGDVAAEQVDPFDLAS